jgi:hypothetical protein
VAKKNEIKIANLAVRRQRNSNVAKKNEIKIGNLAVRKQRRFLPCRVDSIMK